MIAENDADEVEKREEEQDVNEPAANREPDEETAVEITQDEAAADEAEPAAEQEQSKKRKKYRASPALKQITAWFAACGRCSFFLAGYRLIVSDEELETAVANRSKKWLTIPWSNDLAELVHKTYGSRIDISCYHFEGQCVECHRRFTYQGADEAEPATFRIELKP